MDHSSLSSVIDALERGTKLHIGVIFLGSYGNQKTLCTHEQAIHSQPICKAVKKQPSGLSSCYRCRNTVIKAVIRRRKPMAGVCTNGVYEYCRPVIYEDRVVCVIFVGNILTDDPAQRKKLARHADEQLLDTMEKSFSLPDCERISDILESYLTFLLDSYGLEHKTHDPLIENIKNHIRENPAYSLSMSELAASFNYTEKYLGRMFKSKTGRSIKEYSNRIKISQAKKLLTETSLSIETIALQTGFNSATYFDRVFRKTTGFSPHAYRSAAVKRSPQQ